MKEKPIREWKMEMKPALDSKRAEFQMLGYTEATNEEIWRCLEERVWKENEVKRLYEVVADIFQLPTSTYMSYLAIRAHQTEDDLMASIRAVTKSKD